jgi:hypothetical protein
MYETPNKLEYYMEKAKTVKVRIETYENIHETLE